MGKKAVTVLPATLDILMKMGEQIKLTSPQPVSRSDCGACRDQSGYFVESGKGRSVCCYRDLCFGAPCTE